MRFGLLVIIFMLIASRIDAAEPAIRPFLESHCIGCHSGETPSGRLNFEKLLAASDTSSDIWVKAYDRMKAGDMPPAKKPRPTAAELTATLKTLGEYVTTLEASQRATSGRRALRRLNRTEFENTLRDLLDLPGLQVKEMLPDDGRADGYDRSAAALDLSPILLAKYREAVDHALDRAIAPWTLPPERFNDRLVPTEAYDMKIVHGNGDAVMLKDGKYDPRFPLVESKDYGGKFANLRDAEQGGVFREPGTVGFFRQQDEAFQGRFRFAPIHPGRYRINLSTWSFWWKEGEVLPAARTGAAALYVGNRLLGMFDAPSLKPTTHTIDTWLEPGGFLTFSAASLWPIRVSETPGRAAKYTGPGIAVDWIQVEGPLLETWPPPSHRLLLGDRVLTPLDQLPATVTKPIRVLPKSTHSEAKNLPGRLIPGTVVTPTPQEDAERLLTVFLPRAYRRPVSAEEISRVVKLATDRLNAGACFEDAMRTAYRAVLTSPEFLFLQEPVGVLDDYSLANRLSYFLWNSMPDDTLTAIAASGKLHESGPLQAQAERMLKDPKADRFRHDFLDQWLDLRDFDQTTPDKNLYPEWGAYLRDAIRQEPYAYFKELLGTNQPALSLLQSNFTMLNQRLAEHYNIANVTGTAIRKVDWPKDSHRGGFLTQASVMKVTANGTTTSPVKRGAWVCRKLLDDPPQPPPPDIAAIEPDVRGTTTVRQMLAKHRDNASCAACHAKIDPPGFALESFDVIGGFRQRYRGTGVKDLPDLERVYVSHLAPDGKFPTKYYHLGHRLGAAVDATGETASGEGFDGIDSFRKILTKDPKRLARNYVKQLVLYSTGAPLGFSDRAAVDAIVDRIGGDYPLRSLLLETIQSPLFCSR